MDQIKHKSGDFQSFTATRSFALGAFNVTVVKGAELNFDGTVVDYAGMRYTFPQLRGAITAGWLVPSNDFDETNPEYGKPVSAKIKVRLPTDNGPAKPFEAVTEADERVVMSSSEHASLTKAHNLESVKAEDQEGVPVRKMKTATKTKTTLTADTAGSALRTAENVQIEAGEGISEAEMLSRMSPEEKADYLTKKNSLKSRYVDDTATVVGRVATKRNTEKEGIKIGLDVGGGIEIADMSGMTGKPKESVITEDGITFRNTNGPEKLQPEAHPRAKKAMIEDGTADARVQIARAVCKDFPNSYDFTSSAKKKIARLQADYSKRPDVIRAVFAAESDEVKARLVGAFPSVFQK